MWACMSIRPGSTYMPARSISLSPFFASGRSSGSIAMPGWPTLSTRTMRLFSITMSTGPTGGAPVPSIKVAPRRINRPNGPSPSARAGAAGIVLSLAAAAFAFRAAAAAPPAPGEEPGAPAKAGDPLVAPAFAGDPSGAPARAGDPSGAPARAGDPSGAPARAGDPSGAPAKAGAGALSTSGAAFAPAVQMSSVKAPRAPLHREVL